MTTTTNQSPLLRNLCNLTARALLGEWTREEDLRSQVMRLYRDVEYAEPAQSTEALRVQVVLARVTPNGDIQAQSLGGNGWVTYGRSQPPWPAQETQVLVRDATPVATAAMKDGAMTIQAIAPSNPSGFAECPERAKHMNAKRTGKPCAACGYPNLPAVA